MPFDYTDAPPPSFDLIPDGTVATVSIHIRPGNVGEDGMLKRSKEGDCEMLDLELTVLDGPYQESQVLAQLAARRHDRRTEEDGSQQSRRAQGDPRQRARCQA